MIEFRNVDKTFGGRDILRDVSLTVECGEFFVLVGMSGAGKTTILKMMNRLVEPDSGEILFQEKKLTDWDLRELRLNIGYVLQQGALFPNLTVGENIGLIPGLKEWDKAETEREAKRLLALVGLDPAVYYEQIPPAAFRRREAACGHSEGHHHQAPAPSDGRALLRPGSHHPA